MKFIKRIFILVFFLVFLYGRPVHAALKVEVTGSLKEAFDDNVTYVHQNALSDWITSLDVGAGLTAEGPRYHLQSAIEVSQNIFSQHRGFNNTDFTNTILGTLDLSEKDHVRGSESFVIGEQPRTFDAAFGQLNGRYRYLQNKTELGYTRDLNSHLSVSTHYDQESRSYSRRDLSDNQQHRVGGAFGYHLDSANSLGAGYDYAARFYSPGRDIAIQSVFGTYRHFLTKQMFVDLKVGNDFFEIDGQNGQHRLMTEIKLTNDLDENTRSGFSFKKGISTYSNSQDVFDSYQFSGTWARQLTSRLSGGCNGFYGNGKYQTLEIRDQFFGIGLGGEYALTPKSKVGLNYAFSETRSNVSSRSYNKNFVQLHTQITF